MTVNYTSTRQAIPFSCTVCVLTVLTATTCLTTAHPALARTESIAMAGDIIPVPGGELTVIRSGGGSLNDHGQVALLGSGAGPQPYYNYNRYAVYTGYPGDLAVGTYSGAPVPDNITDGVFHALGAPVINNAGELAFRGEFGHTIQSTTDTVLSSTSEGLHAVSEAGNGAPGSQPGITSGYVPSRGVLLNDAGNIMFSASTGARRKLYVSTPDALELVAAIGDAAPGTESGTVYADLYPEDHSLNNLGQFAYRVVLAPQGGSYQRAVYLGDADSEHSLVFRSGGPGPPELGNLFVESVGPPALNDLGEVAFVAQLVAPDLDGEGFTNKNAILSGRPGELGVVVQDGDPAPQAGDGVSFRRSAYPVVLNDCSEVAFRAQLTGPDATTLNDEAIYVGRPGELKLVARKGDAAPGMPDGVRIGSLYRTYSTRYSNTAALNDSGQVAFIAGIEGHGATTARVGVWTGDGIDLIKVRAAGDFYDGRVVESVDISTYSGGSDGRMKSLNERGQILFSAEFEDGFQGAYLFTPDLSWRGTEEDNQWDSRRNWTLSLTPAHVHDVSIGSDTDIYVEGPSADVTVRSLTIGDEEGQAELELQEHVTLTAVETLWIGQNGRISGNGQLAAETVLNDGLIEVGDGTHSLVVDGDYLQSENGTVRLDIMDNEIADTVQVTGSAILDGVIDIGLNTGFAPTHGTYWDILTAETITLNAEVMHPTTLSMEVLSDEIAGLEVLRVSATPEPGTALLAVLAITLFTNTCRHRQRHK